MNLIWKLAEGGAEPTLWELYPTESFIYNTRTYTHHDMVAWIEQRNSYCDRGHWKGQTELGGMDFADAWPNYYMSLERAMLELQEYTEWRVSKVRSTNEFNQLITNIARV